MALATRSPAHSRARPVSPHLGIWKWRANMTVSILHRVTGSGMGTVGIVLLVWWLAAIAGGADSYATFAHVFTTDAGRLNIIGYVVGIGLTLSVFQHMGSGVRHFVLDTGAGYELKTNRIGSYATFGFSILMTLVFWLYLGTK